MESKISKITTTAKSNNFRNALKESKTNFNKVWIVNVNIFKQKIL